MQYHSVSKILELGIILMYVVQLRALGVAQDLCHKRYARRRAQGS